MATGGWGVPGVVGLGDVPMQQLCVSLLSHGLGPASGGWGGCVGAGGGGAGIHAPHA